MVIHVMLDLETASVLPNAALVQLAAVPFTIKPQRGAGGSAASFNYHIKDWDTAGGHVDSETIAWWMTQDAYPKVFGAAYHSQYSEANVLDMFAEWLADTCKGDDLALWGYPSTSDLMWLECAYRRHGYRKLPWEYFSARDLHTLEKEVFHPEVARESVEHDALLDCLHQIRVLWAILDR